MTSSSMRLRRLLASLGVGATLLGATAGVVAAAPAHAATCVYYVKVFAYVRENPSLNSKILKSKGAFDRLTGPCRYSKGFVAVYTSAASDGIGWIDRSKLF